MIINKKIKITVFLFFVLVVLFLIGYLIYDYVEYKKEVENYYFEIPKIVEYESIDNYKILETEEGKRIINENAGLSFLVPNDWNVEKIEGDNEMEIISYDANLEGLGNKTNFPVEGCIIRTGIVYFKKDYLDYFVTIVQKLNDRNFNSETEDLVIINNFNALKTIKFNNSNVGKIILIEIPINNKIYHFGVNFSLKNENRCFNEFNKILKTVSINI